MAIVPIVFALLVAVPMAAQTPVETEMVSTQMYRIIQPDGSTRRVPDIAVSGQVLVQMSPTASPEDVERLLSETNTEILREYRTPGLLLLRLPEGKSVVDAQREIQGFEGVNTAAPDRMKYPLIVPNDPHYSMQYHWPLIEAPEAWNTQTGATDVHVAVVDSGIDLDHPDLASRVWTNTDEIPGNGIDDDENGYVDDVNGYDFILDESDPSPKPTPDDSALSHGSHVAGLIGAATNNATGVAGHDWACKMSSLRVFHGGQPTADSIIMQAVEYAIDNDADIINMSLGGGYNELWTPVLQRAVDEGSVPVAAAGNESIIFTDNREDPMNPWMSPVCNDGPSFLDNNVLGVGATDRNDMVAWFSNLDASSRNFVDVMAPGMNVYSCVYNDPDQGYNSEYGYMSGTSMACPVTAGLCALIKAQYPGFAPEGIITQVRAAAESINDENPSYVGLMGEGRINSANSLVDRPPRLPRSFSAYDKPNDDGGAIQIIWGHSPDDGGGFDDVTGYTLERSTSAEGPFGVLESFPAGGETQYTDQVTDYTPYYYRLGVSDATQTVYTDVAGPVEARDDTAPPAIAEGELIGADVQGDTGGAISLNWRAYDPPSDFGAYRVWRAEEGFESVADFEGPLAVIFDPTEKTYIDRDDPDTAEVEVEDGVQYFYAVTVRDDEPEPNESLDVNAVGPVVASPNFTFIYPPGLSMIAIGAMPQSTDMGDIFGVDDPADLQLARWNPGTDSTGSYILYAQNPGSPFLQQQFGRGYWYRSSVSTVLNISGMPAEGTIRMPLSEGWNQLGNPYTAPMPMEGAKIEVLGTQMTLQESNDQGYTRDYAWTYDTFGNSYKLVSANLPFLPEDQKSVPKGRGFFLNCMTPQAMLIMPRPAVEEASSLSQPEPKMQVDENNWALKLEARCADSADVDNYLGVSPQAQACNDIASPPTPDGGVALSFVDDQGNKSATQFVESLSANEVWTVDVSGSTPGSSVRLSWPDLTQVPADRRLTLYDQQADQTLNMRTSTGYEYTVPKDGAKRRLTITVSDRAANALTVNSLQAVATGAGAQISFTLSQPAEVDVEILNIAGRHVCSVASDKLVPAGTNTVTWNGRAAAAVPAGRYLVAVGARGDDGTFVRAVRTLQIKR